VTALLLRLLEDPPRSNHPTRPADGAVNCRIAGEWPVMVFLQTRRPSAGWKLRSPPRLYRRINIQIGAAARGVRYPISRRPCASPMVLVRSRKVKANGRRVRRRASEHFRGGGGAGGRRSACRADAGSAGGIAIAISRLHARTANDFSTAGDASPEGERERLRGEAGKSPAVQLRLIARAGGAAGLGGGRVKWSREI